MSPIPEGIMTSKQDSMLINPRIDLFLSKILVMPSKPTTKTYAKKRATRKKPSIARMAMIVVAVLIAVAFLFFSIYSPKVKKNSATGKTKREVIVPEFRKDGEVRILNAATPVTVNVEVADNEGERMQGLMYRYAMDENNGMFFIFEEEAPRAFWMKNTYIPLDIIYIGADKEIVSIQKYTQPKSTYSLPSEKPAQYVLEVNAGFSDKYGLKPGDKIEFYK